MRQPPAFQCYASDWLAREAFRLAGLDERGLLWTMLCQVWVSDSLPTDPDDLARLLGLKNDEVARALTPRVLSAFDKTDDGRLVSSELASLKTDYLERHLERSRTGKKGAKAKWGKGKRAMAEPMATLSCEPMATSEKRKAELSRGELSRVQVSRGEFKNNKHANSSGIIAPLSDSEEAAYDAAWKK